MGRILLESGIIVLLVLIGVSILVPSSNDVNGVIVEFESSVSNNEVIDDGVLNNVDVVEEDNSNIVARMNRKIAVVITDGMQRIVDIGIDILRKVID